MLNLELSWQQAAVASGCLFAAAAAAAMTGRPRRTAAAPAAGAAVRPRWPATAAVCGEAGMLLGLFALWQFAGGHVIFPPGGALPRAAWIWHAERVIHLPSEAAIQRVFLPYPLLVQASNLYYAALHFMALIACLIWLFFRHRQHYGRVRTTVVVFTAMSLLIQFIPVAPPRLLPGDHMIDTALRYHQSVYGSVAGFTPDQLSAMPSVHVGWALIVALAVIWAVRGRWRWLALGYPALTTLVVIVTANHFWFDAFAAALLVALALGIQAVGRAASGALSAAWHARRRPARPGPAHPQPAFPVSPVLVSYAPRPASPRDGEAAEAPAAAAAGEEAPPAGPSWHPPPPGPPGRPEPEYEQRPTGSR